MPRKQTREEFIEKAHLVHNNKYDYTKSNIDVSKSNDKIEINCPNHNVVFFQTKKDHLGAKMKTTTEKGYNIELIVYDAKGNVYKNINYNN